MKLLSIGIFISFSALLGSASAASGRYHPDHLFIKMKTGHSLIKSPLIKHQKKIANNIYLVKTSDLKTLEAALSESPTVEYVEKDHYAGRQIMPKLEPLDIFSPTFKNFSMDLTNFNDPRASELWAFSEKNGMNVLAAYETLPHHTAEEIIVAVVDTGVDHNHEDLKDIMWTNDGEIPGDGVDNDKNGYVDDIHGINVLVRDTQGRATMNTMASHWHGTHVSGTIAATQNNAIGITGVANNVKIMAIRTVPDDADELDSDIIEAYRYAAQNGARVINCSFGKSESGMVVRDVIDEIGSKHNVLVIASAGNDSMGPFSWHNNDREPKYPAAFDSANLLVVASTANNASLSSFSNVGKVSVDVAAPGSNILSTINNNQYSSASGTSMASPNTSGVAAMVLGYYPDLSAIQLKKVLIDSVTQVSSFKEKMSSGGRINLPNSLKNAANIR